MYAVINVETGLVLELTRDADRAADVVNMERSIGVDAQMFKITTKEVLGISEVLA